MSHCIVLTNITWDTEGQTLEECNLPETVLVVDSHYAMSERLRDVICSALFESFGFKFDGFEMKRFVEQKTHPGGGYFPPRFAVIHCPRLSGY